jgi:hypothetical protein
LVLPVQAAKELKYHQVSDPEKWPLFCLLYLLYLLSLLVVGCHLFVCLLSLGVLALVPHGVLLVNVCPLFLVAKPGQPYQWRCIAYMTKGHQNQACTASPVHMTCPEDILLWMYPGVFSPVIDASKFFHMFLTVNEEREFMGLIHPDTGYHYWYTRLPMGSSNSPAVSGRFGAAFFSLICQEVEEMQGEVLINDWKVALQGSGFDPKLGIG